MLVYDSLDRMSSDHSGRWICKNECCGLTVKPPFVIVGKRSSHGTDEHGKGSRTEQVRERHRPASSGRARYGACAGREEFRQRVGHAIRRSSRAGCRGDSNRITSVGYGIGHRRFAEGPYCGDLWPGILRQDHAGAACGGQCPEKRWGRRVHRCGACA